MGDKVTAASVWFLGLVENLDDSRPIRIKKEVKEEAVKEEAKEEAQDMVLTARGIKREPIMQESASTAARRRLLEPADSDDDTEKESQGDWKPSAHF